MPIINVHFVTLMLEIVQFLLLEIERENALPAIILGLFDIIIIIRVLHGGCFTVIIVNLLINKFKKTKYKNQTAYQVSHILNPIVASRLDRDGYLRVFSGHL